MRCYSCHLNDAIAAVHTNEALWLDLSLSDASDEYFTADWVFVALRVF